MQRAVGLRTPIERGAKLLTLVLVQRDNQLLLGRKKRGFGEGYYNGFGGKVEAGETIEEAASRELWEECRIQTRELDRRGILWFSFHDKPDPWEVHVFRSMQYEGTPTETDEMVPKWFETSSIPFERMWADDVLWYPYFVGDKFFKGVFFFHDTHDLVGHQLIEVAEMDLEPLDGKLWKCATTRPTESHP